MRGHGIIDAGVDITRRLTEVDSGTDGGQALEWSNPPEGTVRGHCDGGLCWNLVEKTLKVECKLREHDCDRQSSECNVELQIREESERRKSRCEAACCPASLYSYLQLRRADKAEQA